MMQRSATARAVYKAALLLLLLSCVPALPLLAQRGGAQRGEGSPARGGGPDNQRMTGPDRAGQFRRGPGAGPGRRPGGQHLPQWFAQHQGMPANQQEDALRHEPGFSGLPPGQQQQLINRLHRLDMEPPAQRQRMMERNERFEALPPERQQEIRAASQALGQMPPDRRRFVSQAFRDLRNLPPDERQEALDSARFQAEYTPQERTILGNLLSFEP
jgi:hypothetical protein